MRKALLLAVGTITLAAALDTPVLAHEGRFLAPYVVFVGFRNEPAFEDEANALDYFVLYDTDGDGECADDSCSDQIPVNINQFSDDPAAVHDVVEADVKVLYLKDDAFDAEILAAQKLQGELGQDFEDPSRYNIFFKPNVDGAYGFLIKGKIQYRGSDPRFPNPGPEVTVDEKFVCGGGSQAKEEAFSCVADILQPFPGGAQANYRDNPPLSGESAPASGSSHKPSVMLRKWMAR